MTMTDEQEFSVPDADEDFIILGEQTATIEPVDDTLPATRLDEKVTASLLASAGCGAVFALLAENNIDVSTITVSAVTGFVVLLFGYVWPNGRHNN